MKNAMRIRSFVLLAVFFLGLSAWAPAKTWTVNKSGGGDFSTFAAALAGVGDNDTIQFTDTAAVTYDEGTTALDWDAMSVPMHITVTAAQKNVVTLKVWNLLTATGRVYSFSDITFIPATNATYGDIFTVSGGTGTFTDCIFDCATGIEADRAFTANGGTLTLTNCTVKNFVGGYSWPILLDYGAVFSATGTTFENIQCSSIGGFSGKTSATLSNCAFVNTPQLSNYPAIAMNPGTVNVTNTTFSTTKGTFLGVRNDYTAGVADKVTAKFTNCKMTAPATGADAPFVITADAPALDGTFENCIFDGADAAFWGTGKVEASKSTFKITNCLLLQKFAGWGAAIMADDGSFDTFEVKNCIIDSLNEGIHLGSSAQLLATSDFNLLNRGGWNDGNFGTHSMDGRSSNIDPLFVNAAAGDYHLQPSSPCAGRGAMLLTTDYDGTARPLPALASKCDIGPFEVAEVIKVWTVNKSATADFSSYKAALQNPQMKSNDHIQFTDTAAVTYDESASLLDWETLNVPDAITVEALNKGVVSVKAEQRLTPLGRDVSFKNITFLPVTGKNTLYGNQANLTVIDCVFDGIDDWCFMIQADAGNTRVTGTTFKNSLGGYSAAFFGGWSAVCEMVNCTFDNLSSSAARSAGEGMTLTMDGCTATNCAQVGGQPFAFIALYSGTATVTNSTIGVSSGEVFTTSVWDVRTPMTTGTGIFKNCVLSSSSDGRIIQSGPNAKMELTLDNCILKGGITHIFLESTTGSAGKITADHCLFLDCMGSILSGPGSDLVTVTNSIIDASNQDGFHPDNKAVLAGDYNLYNKAGYNDDNFGANSLDGRTTPIDPRYVDAANGNYHLLADSPCAGKAMVTDLDTDFDGVRRPSPAWKSFGDIGPFEVDETNGVNAVKMWSLY